MKPNKINMEKLYDKGLLYDLSTFDPNKGKMLVKVIGFKLKVKYPGCNKEIGYFEPLTTGEFMNYPDIWEPVWVDDTSKEINKESNVVNYTKDLNFLSKSIYKANKEKGFWDKERNVGELLMLITSELGEAMEAHRKGKFANRRLYEAIDPTNRPNHDIFSFRSTIKDSFEDEIADTLIRLLDLCGGLGIDIAWHVENKLKYNKTRERLHGKKY